VAWTKWSDRHLHTKWELCGSWKERLSRSQVEFSFGIWKSKIEISKVLPILWKLNTDFFIVFQFFKVSWVKTYLDQETSDDWKSLNSSYKFQPTSMVCGVTLTHAMRQNLIWIHPKNAMLGLQMLDLDFVSGSMQRSRQIGLEFTLPSFICVQSLK
jgi:hypothetical protein